MPFAAPEKDRKPIGPAEPRPMVDPLFFIGPSGALLGLFVVYILYYQMGKPDSENEPVSETSEHLSIALNQQTQFGLGVLGAIFVALLMLYFAGLSPASIAPAFLIGGFCSAMSSQLSAALFRRANARILKADSEDTHAAERLAQQGSVAIGLIPASIALLYISTAYLVMTGLLRTLSLSESTTIMVCFALGSSVQALLARGGAEILRLNSSRALAIGKESPLQLVGTTVRRVSGNVADLYDSFACANLASIALAVSAVASFAPTDTTGQARVSLLPIALSGIGVIASLFGATLKADPLEQAPAGRARPYIRRSIAACALFCGASAGISFLFLRGLTIPSHFGWGGLWGCAIAGTLAGLLLTLVARALQGIRETPGWSFLQACPPAWILASTLLGSFWMAGGFSNPALGMFGLSLTSVGLLAPMSLFVGNQVLEAFSDNAAFQARTTESSPEVFRAVSRLVARPLQNFSIAGSFFSAVALFGTYGEEIKRQLIAIASQEPKAVVWGSVEIDQVAARAATFVELAGWYQITLWNPLVHFGLLIGATIPLALAGLITLVAQRNSADSDARPDSLERTQQVAQHAYRQLPPAGLFLLVLPALAGLILGPAGTMGLLLGCTLSGCLLGLLTNESRDGLSGSTLNVCSKLVSLSALLGAGLTVSLAPAIASYLGFV